MRLFAILIALLITALPAQGDPASDNADALESCVVTAWPRDVLALCTGTIADPCQMAPGGDTTLGMDQCLSREADAWDVVLNREWPKLMTRASEIDAANQTGGLALDSAAETLRAAQRAWIVFRDAECRANYASWGAGSFRTIAHSACRLDLTARRVVDFYARLMTEG
ncbi:MAG TPA: lysozyme inhibitor LprI family protein [Thermohalobaculum sp.]|nr:lysozyme inhibitor LprI family protein [Thermohalobaculum sp.]